VLHAQEIAVIQRKLAPIAIVLLAGCASQSSFLDQKQAMAVDAALARGKFDLN